MKKWRLKQHVEELLFEADFQDARMGALAQQRDELWAERMDLESQVASLKESLSHPVVAVSKLEQELRAKDKEISELTSRLGELQHLVTELRSKVNRQ